MITTTFTVREAEYIEAQQLYLRTTSVNRVRYGLLAVLVFSLISVLVTAKDIPPADWAKGAGPVGLIALLVSFPVLQKRSFRKRYLIEAAALTDVTVQLDESGYRSQAPGQGAHETPWSAFTSYAEGGAIFVLFRGYSFNAIPKRALSETDRDAARALISGKLPLVSRKVSKKQGQ